MPRGSHRCAHAPYRMPTPQADACQTCGTTENRRMCLHCGFVGCCESKGAHAKEHYEQTGHVMISVLPLSPASFVWCYSCSEYVYGPTDHPACPEACGSS